MIRFGTAGLRGEMGPGFDNMNDQTVALATRGVAAWVGSGRWSVQGRGVVIAFDIRHHSADFAHIAANTLAEAGIPVWLFPDYQPTPMLVFSIRRLGAAAGIVITASHNPRQYNGYKVYNSLGFQIDSADAAIISSAMEKAAAVAEGAAPSTGQSALIQSAPASLVQDYHNYVYGLWPCSLPKAPLRAVYTPMHGTGGKHMAAIFTASVPGQLFPVPQQMEPDPDFHTAPAPNPEDPKVLELARELATEVDADLILATDPDADRAAVMLRDDEGQFYPLNGNEIGGLLLHLLLTRESLLGHPLPSGSALVKTVVTDDFGATIAREAGLEVFTTLTGFKNICGIIPRLLESGRTFFMGYEESIGYAFPDEVRDKDGLAACRILAGATATLKARGSSLHRELQHLYEKHGWFLSAPFSHVDDAPGGSERIRAIVDRFRHQPIDQVGGGRLQLKQDYDAGLEYQLDEAGAVTETRKLDLDRQDLLVFKYENGCSFALRPSGTEPKLKFYLYARDMDRFAAEVRLSELNRLVREKAEGPSDKG